MNWLLYIPGFTCLFWALIHCMIAFRTDHFKYLITLSLVTGLFLLADAAYDDRSSGFTMHLISYMALLGTAPCIVPLTSIYLRHIRRNDPPVFTAWPWVWLIIPSCLFTAGGLLLALSDLTVLRMMLDDVAEKGTDGLINYRGTVEYLFYVVVTRVLRLIIVVQMIYLAGALTVGMIRQKARFEHIFNYYFRKSKINTEELQLFNSIPIALLLAVKMIIGADYPGKDIWLSLSFSVLLVILLTNFWFVGMFSVKRNLSLQQARNSMRYNYKREKKHIAIERMMTDLIAEADDDTLRRIQEKIEDNLSGEPTGFSIQYREMGEEQPAGNTVFDNLADNWDENSLMGRFQQLMVDEKLFLQPRLSLQDVAERLNSNKTYVSKLVNNSFKMGFPELINTMRVDYAEEYIIRNRQAKQTEIAAACGFLSASSFNNIFKNVTGVTPKVWIANYERDKTRQ